MIRIVDPKQPHLWLETLLDVFRGLFAKPRS
jgi:hypothetical protein